MPERLPQPNHLEFNRVIPPELVDTHTTVDAFRATIPIPEALGGDAAITVTLGDLLALPVRVDAIAYPYDGDAKFTAGILSEQITYSAGTEIFGELAAKQGRQPLTGNAYTTSAGGLSSQTERIMHVVINPNEPDDGDDIERTVTGALQTATNEGIKSIAMPLFGTSTTSSHPVSSPESLTRMARAAEQFITANPETPTKDVRIVAYFQPSEAVLNGVEQTLQDLS